MLDPLVTARLLGERPRPEHRDGLLGVLGDPLVGDVLWPGELGGARNPEQVQAILANDAEHWEREGFGPWVFSERHGAGAVVARGGLMRAHVNNRDEVEIDCAVAAPHWGEGLATDRARVRAGGLRGSRAVRGRRVHAHQQPRLPTRDG